jgi:hypothetical protein
MSGQASTAKSQVVDKQAKEFRELREPFADLIGGQFGNIRDLLNGDINFDGSSINLDNYRNPMTPGEIRALEGLGAANTPSANDLASEQLLGQTLSGDFVGIENNPGLSELIRYTNSEINNAYNTQGLEQAGLFARAGQSLPESSPFAQAQGDLSAARLDAIGKNTSMLVASNYENERGRQMQAVEQQRANAGFEFTRQLEFLQANSLPRLIDEIGFDRAFTEFQSRLAALSQALGIAADITAPALGTESRSKGKGGGIVQTGSGGGEASSGT